MKRIISIIIAVTMCLTCAFVIPATTHQEDACAATKYIKVKVTTYNKYKKAYKNQKTLKLTISEQKATIAEQKLEITELNATIKEKKQTISWLWDTLEENGFYYNYDTHRWEYADPSYEEGE